MKCMLAVSRYGVIVLDEDSNIEWELSFYDMNTGCNDCPTKGKPHSVRNCGDCPNKTHRLYGLDINKRDNCILVSYMFPYGRIEEWNFETKELKWRYEIRKAKTLDSTIDALHSTYYGSTYDEIIVTSAENDRVFVIDRDEGLKKEIYMGDYFSKPVENFYPPTGDGSDDWCHINYARKFGDKLFVSAYRHPRRYIDGSLGGMCMIFDKDYNLVRQIGSVVDKPHNFVPYPYDEDKLIISDTGNERIIIYDKLINKITWKYYPEKVPLPPKEEWIGSKRPEVKYGSGAHYISMVKDKNQLFFILPNHREARIIDIGTKEIIHTWKIPKHIYEDTLPGDDPRAFLGLLIYDE